MKTLEDAISFEQLYKAFLKCRSSARWKDSVANYSANAVKNTVRLRQSLLDGSYQIQPYSRFVVTEPKRRDVIATQIRDRQFQRSLCDNILYEDLTEHFIYDNCACQRGKGVDFALDRMATHLHRFYREHGTQGYVLRCDIYHYFAETSHEVAKAAVKCRIRDPRVYEYVAQIIDSFGEKGIGLGCQVSQLVQLSILDDIDHYIKEKLRIKHYIRYMDDLILVHHDRVYLKQCLDIIRDRLQRIGYTLNNKTQLFRLSQGVSWLQWRFCLTNTGKVIRIPSRCSKHRERRKLAGMRRNQVSLSRAAVNFMSWSASAERRKHRKYTQLRRNGRVLRRTHIERYVESMRNYFIKLFGIDPYLIKT